jgi:hypothetical protein
VGVRRPNVWATTCGIHEWRIWRFCNRAPRRCPLCARVQAEVASEAVNRSWGHGALTLGTGTGQREVAYKGPRPQGEKTIRRARPAVG